MESSLAGKRIVVMGLGVHGGAVGNAMWLSEQGANLTLTDMKTADALKEAGANLEDLPDAKLVLGEHREEDFKNADIVLRNPAVPRDSKFLQIGREAGATVEMDSSLFLKLSPTKSIVGVTGSKGKSTTTAVIATLLEATRVGVEGASPLAALREIGPDSTVVFELSSWRLEALAEHGMSPTTAVVTSLYCDHLNTYDSFDEYVATKKAIIENQSERDRVLLNADDERVAAWAPEAHGDVWWYSLERLPDGQGVFIEDGQVVVRRDGQEAMLFDESVIPFQFAHERRNALPGILLAYLAGVPVDDIEHRLKTVTGLPHRMELVRNAGGVDYFNDSAATMPDATIAALAALHERTIVHIAGGNDKELQFEEWAQAEAKAHIRTLIWLPGTATGAMKAELERASADAEAIPAVDAANMDEAVRHAAASAHSGDVVLLSPGATSFGLFQHEFDRGDAFRRAVQKLADR